MILVENGNGLKIEKSGKLKGGVGYRTVPEGQKIFLGKIKKPALRVGFLNACLAKICPCNPKKIKVPVLSRLQMERIAEEFELMGKLEKKARGLELKVDLRIARVI